jgi:hypothetical protein
MLMLTYCVAVQLRYDSGEEVSLEGSGIEN